MGYQYNLGICNAKGKYIGFCESDDYMELSAYENIYKAAEDNQYPDVVKSDFCFFITRDCGELSLYYSTFLRKYGNLYEKTISAKSYPFLLLRDINIWNGIYKREFLEEKGILFNETLGAAFQDAGFILQVHITAGSEYFLQQAYYHYRKDNEGASVYKKEIYKYALWELEYMIDWLEQNEQYAELWAHMVLERLFCLFAGFYGNYYLKNKEKTCSELLKLQKKVRSLYQTHSDNLRSELQKIPFLMLFLENTELFAQAVVQKAKHTLQELSGFGDVVKKAKRVIIFGCGESGQSLLAMLLKNRYEGEICFCDNNQEKWKEKIMGYPVVSVERACKEWGSASFLVPGSSLYWKKMKMQILKNGVCTENIVVAPFVGPHSSMEVHWNVSSLY